MTNWKELTGNAAVGQPPGRIAPGVALRAAGVPAARIGPGLEVRAQCDDHRVRAARRDGTASSTSWPTGSASSPRGPARRSSPSIRFEQPWPQWVTLLVVLGSSALRRLALPSRRGGLAPVPPRPGVAPDRPGPAGGLHALRGRAVGRADRACRTSSSWSTTRRASRWPTSTTTPRRRPPPRHSPRPRAGPRCRAGRSARVCSGRTRGSCSANSRSRTRSGSTSPRPTPRLLARDRHARRRRPRAREAREGRAQRRSVEARRVGPPGPDRTPGRPPSAVLAPHRRPDDRRREPCPRPPNSPREKGCRSTPSASAVPSRPATWS